MNLFLIIISIILGLFVLFQIYIFLKSKMSVGNSIPFEKMNSNLATQIKNKKSILYFYSPTCHNCKAQTPIIEKLKKEFASIISINIAEDLETAKLFNVMGTPSLLFLDNNKIAGFYVGVRNESFIRNKLAGD